MKKSLFGTLFTAAVLCTSSLSHASLENFHNYNLGGVSASWDIFYGGNYLPSWNFTTGTHGNPLVSESGANFILNVVNPGWEAGVFESYATGPIDSDGSTIGGNRELFYTLFASPAKFTISGIVAGNDPLNAFTLQILQQTGSQGGISNVSLNGFIIEDSGVRSGVQYWEWVDLGLTAGQSFTLTFDTEISHSNIDAVQIQMNSQAVPEPTTWMLIGLGTAFALWHTRRRVCVTNA